jgi:hypothetical protein
MVTYKVSRSMEETLEKLVSPRNGVDSKGHVLRRSVALYAHYVEMKAQGYECHYVHPEKETQILTE